MWPGRFLKNISDLLAPRGDAETRKQTPLIRTHHQLWMFRFGTGYTVVAEVGVAGGSRATYDVGI